MFDFYTTYKILSYTTAIFFFIIGARNLGKTTAFKVRAIKRFLRKKRKTVWVRRFSKEAKKTARKFFTKKVCELSGVDAERLKFEGQNGYILIGKRWYHFITIVALSEYNSERSSEDDSVDTIVFDEFTTTPAKYRLYRGNEASDFIDLFVSTKRVSHVRVFFLGNKESITNPYFKYFRIAPPEIGFNGIRTYKNGSVVLQVVDDLPDAVKDSYDKAFTNALNGTPYYDYLTEGTYKNAPKNTVKLPKHAQLYAQLDFGSPVSVYVKNGLFYVKSGVDKSRRVYTGEIGKDYKKQYTLKRAEHIYFEAFLYAVRMNNVMYCDVKSHESVLPFYQFFNVK